MEVELREYTKYKENEMLELYQSVGWSNYYKNPEMLEQAYAHSLYTVAAYHKEKLVGIIRVVGDGASIIYIQDLLIFPDYQRKGIGRQLLEHVLKCYESVYQKVLITDDSKKTEAFYKAMGFSTVEETAGVCFIAYTF